MLTSVQKEILQTLINLYRNSGGKSIKGGDSRDNEPQPRDNKKSDAVPAALTGKGFQGPGADTNPP